MLITNSRPYTKAAFEYAKATKNLSQWLQFLQLLALVVKDKLVKKILLNPTVNQNKIAKICIAVMKPLPIGGDNFIQLLALQRRLNLLPYIVELFTQYYSQAEKILVIEVTTATKLTELQDKNLSVALQKYFRKTINMKMHVDTSLLGGALIRANDLVIDVSVKRKLKNLEQQII